MIKHLLILAAILCTGTTHVFGQLTDQKLEKFNQDRLQINRNGMTVLGSWAVGNIITGAIVTSQTSGTTKSFHQMNLAWNSVNLAIAGFGYFGSRETTSRPGLSKTIREFRNFENLLLFNAGLDLGYMASGAYLWERGIRKNSARLVGYGQSLILQGGFLFMFDLVLFKISRNRHNELLKLVDNVFITDNGIGYRRSF